MSDASRIAIDVGGTFTDVVRIRAGEVGFEKVPTTPKDPKAGVLSGFEAAGVPFDEIDYFIHGTTLGLNALLTRRGAKTGIVTTEGFRDVYLLGRTARDPMYDFKYRRPDSLVARYDIYEVPERLDFEGNVLREFDEARAREVAAETVSRFGRVDLLVNNAAASPLSPFHEISPETFEATINTNIRSLFYLTQVIWKKMRDQRAGVIVNISSLSAVDPFDGLGFYGACKAWMDLMTQSLASEGADLGLRVCSVRPGAVETPMLRRLFPDFPSEQCVEPRRIAETVWGCVSEPENYPSGEAFTITDQP